MRIIFMGTPEFSVPILKALNEKYEIALVISQPNREKKKGVLLDTPVASCAKELGLNLIQPEKISESFEEIKSYNCDTLITAAYGQYVPTKILNLFKFKLNVHGSLLPKHRGGAPIQRCLIEGDKSTGVTIMEMVKALDSGKMYAKSEYVIDDNDNATMLFEKLSIIGKDLLLDVIDDIYSGKLDGIPQDESEATYSPNIAPEEEEIDINDTAVNIRNRVRGLAMNPGAYLKVNNVNLKIFDVKVLEDKSDLKPGTVISTKKGIVIKAGCDAISLLSVLMPGKKIMSGKDFSNGQKIFNEGEII